MADSRHQLLDDALAMSRRMAQLGDSGEWDAVIELEPQRRALLERAFATHAPADEFVAERVRTILDLDRRLMAQSTEARDRIAAELSKSSKGRKAASAYQSVGS
ncbi:MAG: flagellar protein FliT [Gammaproteobacteria bacterium]|nr:flagellar protein FliT [Gammaproteobacteria bacterium]